MSKYKVAYYIRLSLEEQSKGLNQKLQKTILDEWIKETEWMWVKTYYDEVIEKDKDLIKFQELINDAKHGLFNGICIIDSDRFSKSSEDLLKIMDDLLTYGVKLHIYNLKHIDIYSEKGRNLLNNLEIYSEFFRGQLSSKIRAGVKQKMKNEWFGQAPYGYSIISDDINGRKKNTRLIKNNEEQKVILKMNNLRKNSKSYSEIALSLNKEGIPTRHSRENKKSIWYSSTVRNILNRREIILEGKY